MELSNFLELEPRRAQSTRSRIGFVLCRCHGYGHDGPVKDEERLPGATRTPVAAMGLTVKKFKSRVSILIENGNWMEMGGREMGDGSNLRARAASEREKI